MEWLNHFCKFMLLKQFPGILGMKEVNIPIKQMNWVNKQKPCLRKDKMTKQRIM